MISSSGMAVVLSALNASAVDMAAMEIDPIHPPKIYSGCLVGYATNDGVLVSSIAETREFRDKVYAIPRQIRQAKLIEKLAGNRVRLCGRFRADVKCWTGGYVCAPYRYKLMISKVRSLEMQSVAL
jgi:hypothetical protein